MSISIQGIINRALRIIRAESKNAGQNEAAREFAADTVNDVLAQMNITAATLPYQEQISFDTEASKAVYTLGTASSADIILPNNFASIDYVNYFSNGFRYSVEIIDNYITFSNITAKSITGRPRQVWISPIEDAYRFEFFPTPERVYEIQILAKGDLAQYPQTAIIPLPLEYREYIIYSVAKRLNSQLNLRGWGQVEEDILRQSEIKLQAKAPKDNVIRTLPPIRPYTADYTPYRLGVITR